MKKLVYITLLFTFFSCQESFSELEKVNDIDGVWVSDEETFYINTEEMKISINYTIPLVLTSRYYDRSLITVSIGSVFFFDAKVFINNDKTAIKLKKNSSENLITYHKKKEGN